MLSNTSTETEEGQRRGEERARETEGGGVRCSARGGLMSLADTQVRVRVRPTPTPTPTP